MLATETTAARPQEAPRGARQRQSVRRGRGALDDIVYWCVWPPAWRATPPAWRYSQGSARYVLSRAGARAVPARRRSGAAATGRYDHTPWAFSDSACCSHSFLRLRRARDRRDITVPIGTPVTVAISL